MNLTNIHKSFLLFFAFCSFASFVFLFQFNTTNGVLADGESKFGLHYVDGVEENPILIQSYDMFCALEAESIPLKKLCSIRKKLVDLTTAASYVTLVFCISLFSGFFFVLEKKELSLISKSIGIIIICLYVADVVLHGVMFSEDNSFYSAVKEASADFDGWNRGQSMVYIGGSLACHLAISGAILIYLIYSCYKKNGYTFIA